MPDPGVAEVHPAFHEQQSTQLMAALTRRDELASRSVFSPQATIWSSAREHDDGPLATILEEVGKVDVSRARVLEGPLRTVVHLPGRRSAAQTSLTLVLAWFADLVVDARCYVDEP